MRVFKNYIDSEIPTFNGTYNEIYAYNDVLVPAKSKAGINLGVTIESENLIIFIPNEKYTLLRNITIPFNVYKTADNVVVENLSNSDVLVEKGDKIGGFIEIQNINPSIDIIENIYIS